MKLYIQSPSEAGFFIKFGVYMKHWNISSLY